MLTKVVAGLRRAPLEGAAGRGVVGGGMTPDELLRRYPRETLRWLRRRLSASQPGLAARVGVAPQTVAAWEARRYGIAPANEERLAALLAPHLAMPEGQAFARELAGSPAEDTASPTTRAGLQRVWRAGGGCWAAVSAHHRPRNLAIARAYLETTESRQAIAAHHGVSPPRVAAISRSVVYQTLHRRPPSR